MFKPKTYYCYYNNNNTVNKLSESEIIVVFIILFIMIITRCDAFFTYHNFVTWNKANHEIHHLDDLNNVEGYMKQTFSIWIYTHYKNMAELSNLWAGLHKIMSWTFTHRVYFDNQHSFSWLKHSWRSLRHINLPTDWQTKWPPDLVSVVEV